MHSKLFVLEDNARLVDSEKCIGFLANVKDSNPKRSLFHFHYDRLIPIAKYLDSKGIDLFVYSPAAIDFSTNQAHGYVIRNNDFVPVHITCPKVNGDWVLNYTTELAAENKSFKQFINWIQNFDIKLYSSFDFAKLAGDKLRVYEQLKSIPEINQPKTEVFNSTVEQLKYYTNNFECVFIKPQLGARSEKIFYLEWESEKLRMSYYPTDFSTPSKKQVFSFSSLDDALAQIKSLLDNEIYIIQQGIKVARYNDAPIELRVLMVNQGNGDDWLPIDIVYIGFSGTHISNQPHTADNSHRSHKLLGEVYGKENANMIIESMLLQARLITKYLNNFFHNQVAEMAFDFVLDSSMKLYFLEINTKPAIIAPEIKLVSPIFNILP